MTTRHAYTTVVLTTSLFLATSVWAQGVAVGGSGTMSRLSLDRTDLADGQFLLRERVAGVIRTDDENSPLHLNSEDCLFTTVHAADGTLRQGRALCDFVHTDGDVWWLTGDLKMGTWQITGGTGKYEHMTGGGTFAFQVQFPDGRSSFRFDGRHEM